VSIRDESSSTPKWRVPIPSLPAKYFCFAGLVSMRQVDIVCATLAWSPQRERVFTHCKRTRNSPGSAVTESHTARPGIDNHFNACGLSHRLLPSGTDIADFKCSENTLLAGERVTRAEHSPPLGKERDHEGFLFELGSGRGPASEFLDVVRHPPSGSADGQLNPDPSHDLQARPGRTRE